jgi:adenosylhomocysteinase
MKVGIIGFGKIGRSILHHLLQRSMAPMVYEDNPIRRVKAYNLGAQIPDLQTMVSRSDVIFSATGAKALGIINLREIKSGSFVFSVTSSDDEFDLSFLRSEYKAEPIAPYVTKYFSFHNYFFLVNNGDAVNFIHKAVVGNFIHLVRAEMIAAVSHLQRSTLSPGLHESPEETRKRIAEIWIDTCVSEKPVFGRFTE